MPSIIVPCPQCSHQLHLPDRAYLGRKGRCPQCQLKFVMDEDLVVDEAEAKELMEAQAAEAARVAAEQRAEEQRAAEEQAAKERAAEEQRQAEEQARAAEEQRLAEEKRREEEQRVQAEQQRAAEQKAAEERAAEEKAAEERLVEAEQKKQAELAAQHAETQREGMPLTAGETVQPDPATVKTELNPMAAVAGTDETDGETVEYNESAAAAMAAMIGEEDDELPEQFGRYRILEAIGQGSMGAVYLAHDGELDRKIALKIPRFSDPDSTEEVERFFREARAAATLRHPNICQVFDIGEIDGRHFIAMEFISGNPLSVFIAQPKFQPVRKIAATIRKVAKALQEAHDNGLVHRDLKPDNIMIDERGEPTIMDFGLVRLMNDDDRITTSGAIVGSPAYMSPEQVSGTADDVGPPSDIFSLGTITYELLTRRRPFRGSLSAIFEQISQSDPLAPSKLRSDIDRNFESICLRMMARDLSERYASMSELADALSDYLKDTSTSAISGKSAVPLVPKTAQPVAPAGSPDETAARWILEIGGVLKVSSAESKSVTVPDVNSLPAAPYQVVDVALVKNAAVTDEGLAHLSALKHLLVLRLSETGITDSGLPCLSGLTGLPVLDLSYTKVTDAGLKHLKGLKGLKQLDLANTKITDAGLASLRKLGELQFLGLYATGVTDSGIKTLSSLKNLQFLGLYGTEVTDDGVAKLKKSLRNCTISR